MHVTCINILYRIVTISHVVTTKFGVIYYDFIEEKKNIAHMVTVKLGQNVKWFPKLQVTVFLSQTITF